VVRGGSASRRSRRRAPHREIAGASNSQIGSVFVDDAEISRSANSGKPGRSDFFSKAVKNFLKPLKGVSICIVSATRL
jgi:hypothetical protein